MGCGRGFMRKMPIVTVVVRAPPSLGPHPEARPMAAAIVRRTDAGSTISVAIPYKASMLDAEEAIQSAPNQAGVAATEEVLSRFDADGQPIRLGTIRLTSMGKVRKDYLTPTAS